MGRFLDVMDYQCAVHWSKAEEEILQIAQIYHYIQIWFHSIQLRFIKHFLYLMHSEKKWEYFPECHWYPGVYNLPGEIKHRDLTQMNNTNKGSSTQRWPGLVPNLGFSWSQVNGDLISAILGPGADSLLGQGEDSPSVRGRQTACRARAFLKDIYHNRFLPPTELLPSHICTKKKKKIICES